MKAIKMNNADNYESINIILSKENTPIAYQNKLDELMNCKAFDTQSEAEKWLSETPIELELYYENGYGLFGVEAEAVESMKIQSPYSGAPILDEDEIDQFNDDDKSKYIPKSDLIAEIQRRIKICQDYAKCNLTESTRIGNNAQHLELETLLSFIQSYKCTEQ